MVAIAPKVGRPSRHSWRRRLSGAGFAEVKAETPNQMCTHVERLAGPTGLCDVIERTSTFLSVPV